MTFENSSTRPLDGIPIEHNIPRSVINMSRSVLGFANIITSGINDLRSSETREIHLPEFLIRH